MHWYHKVTQKRFIAIPLNLFLLLGYSLCSRIMVMTLDKPQFHYKSILQFNSKFLKKQACVRENLYALIFFAQTFQEDKCNLS